MKNNRKIINTIATALNCVGNAMLCSDAQLNLADALVFAKWNLIGRGLGDDITKCNKLMEALIEKAKEIENERNEQDE